MVYKLISDKIDNLEGWCRKVSTDNSNRINLLKNRISEINRAQERLANLMMNDELDEEIIKLLNEKAKEIADEKSEVLSKTENLENEESEIKNILTCRRNGKLPVMRNVRLFAAY